MTPSVFDRANAVGKYAAKLIFDLQREYTAESGSNARSRARFSDKDKIKDDGERDFDDG